MRRRWPLQTAIVAAVAAGLVDAAKADLGYDPKVGLREGLRRTIAAFEHESIEVAA